MPRQKDSRRILRTGFYRFFFYAGDYGEPPHIHVESNDNIAKFWIDPVIFESSRGFGRKEINRIQKLVEKYQETLLRGWNEFFND